MKLRVSWVVSSSSYGLLEIKEILAFRVSFTRSSLDAELFLKDKPLFLVDKGPWYKEAFKSLGLGMSTTPSV